MVCVCMEYWADWCSGGCSLEASGEKVADVIWQKYFLFIKQSGCCLVGCGQAVKKRQGAEEQVPVRPLTPNQGGLKTSLQIQAGAFCALVVFTRSEGRCR